MSNYPLGAEHDSSAPFNREELQGETIGLFEYLENLEMPYSVRCELKSFDENRNLAIKTLLALNNDFKKGIRNTNLHRLIIKYISEPQIFIENE
jgi:hypothetical protein